MTDAWKSKEICKGILLFIAFQYFMLFFCFIKASLDKKEKENDIYAFQVVYLDGSLLSVSVGR